MNVISIYNQYFKIRNSRGGGGGGEMQEYRF